jgi:hypothetical protein
MAYFTKRQEAYAIPSQETLTMVEALVTNLCRFIIPQELHGDQDHNFESCLIKEVLQRLGVDKTPTTTIHPQLAWWNVTSEQSRSTYEKLSH